MSNGINKQIIQIGGGGGTGDVVGPASSTDNAIARFDSTTGKLIQNSSAIIDDSGNISATNLSGTNTGDQTSIVGITGTKAQFDTDLTDDNFAYLGASNAFTAGQTITNADTGSGLFIDQNGNGAALFVDTEATTANGVNIQPSVMTTGTALLINSATAYTSGRGLAVDINSASMTGAVAYLRQDAATASGHVLYIVNDGTGNGLYVDSNGSGYSAIFDGGNVGIGTTAPDGNLHIRGASTTVPGLVLEVTQIGSNQIIEIQNDGGAKRMGIIYDNTTPGFGIQNRSGVDLLRVVEGTGNVGIGTTAPTASLHIKAGTATASTAPLKLTSGTNLTTPENGAFEYDGTNLYFTTGGVRKTVTLV